MEKLWKYNFKFLFTLLNIKKARFLFYSLLIGNVLLFLNCKKNSLDTTTIDFGKDYFPIKIGYYIIYEVDSTAYDELTHQAKSYQYQLKEIITEAFTNDENTTSYRLERYIRYYDSTKPYEQIPWQIKDVWTITPYSNNIVKVEENIPFVKLIFPVKVNAQWNGNAKNTLGTQTYKYEYVNTPETIDNIYFSQTLKVQQYQYRSLIQYQNEVEKYARNVGMVYKEIIRLESQTIIPGVPVENRPEKGFIYKMKIVDWKK